MDNIESANVNKFERLESLIEDMFSNSQSAIAKDLKLNFKKFMFDSGLSRKETTLLSYSLAGPLHLKNLEAVTYDLLVACDYNEAQIQEAKESAAFMAMLNSYYKFKNYSSYTENLGNAGLRMNALAKHVLSNKEFELIALAHSLLNGCEYCIKAHEQVLLKLNVNFEQVHDVARLTSILKGFSVLKL